MTLAELLPLVAQASIFLLVFSVGLQSRWSDVVHAIRTPRQLLRALVAVNLIVPATAIVLCLLLPVAPYTSAGLAIMAVSPPAPFAPLKMLKAGAARSYAIGIYVALIVAAVLIVPATAAILNPLLPRGVTIPVVLIGAYVLKTILVPLLLGVAVGSRWPNFGERSGPIGTITALLVLLPIIFLIFLKFGGQIAALVGDGSLAVIVATVAAGLAAGYWLGGPEPSHRMALAQAAVTRHPAIAVLIAHLHSGETEVMLAIMLFLLVSIVVSASFEALSMKRAKASSSAQA